MHVVEVLYGSLAIQDNQERCFKFINVPSVFVNYGGRGCLPHIRSLCEKTCRWLCANDD